MVIRNGDEVKFQDGKGEIRGRVLTISRKGLNKGQALLEIDGLTRAAWIIMERLSKV